MQPLPGLRPTRSAKPQLLCRQSGDSRCWGRGTGPCSAKMLLGLQPGLPAGPQSTSICLLRYQPLLLGRMLLQLGAPSSQSRAGTGCPRVSRHSLSSLPLGLVQPNRKIKFPSFRKGQTLRAIRTLLLCLGRRGPRGRGTLDRFPRAHG